MASENSMQFPLPIDQHAFINQSEETRAHHRDNLISKTYPLIVLTPTINPKKTTEDKTKIKEINNMIENELKTKGFLNEIVSIKFTEAKNLIVIG